MRRAFWKFQEWKLSLLWRWHHRRAQQKNLDKLLRLLVWEGDMILQDEAYGAGRWVCDGPCGANARYVRSGDERGWQRY